MSPYLPISPSNTGRKWNSILLVPFHLLNIQLKPLWIIMLNGKIFLGIVQNLPAVPRQWFGLADCDTIHTIYLSLFKETADPSPFRGTHCTYINIFPKSCNPEIAQYLCFLLLKSRRRRFLGWFLIHTGGFMKKVPTATCALRDRKIVSIETSVHSKYLLYEISCIIRWE